MNSSRVSSREGVSSLVIEKQSGRQRMTLPAMRKAVKKMLEDV